MKFRPFLLGNLFAAACVWPLCSLALGEDPNATLARLTKAVENDQQCGKLSRTLLDYAKAQVALHKNAILANLESLRRNNGSDLDVFDLVWPGAGYNSVACGGNYEVLSLLQKDGILKIGNIMGSSGGNYEVLSLLQKDGILKIGNIMGSSGGALSAIMALADANQSSSTLLKYYMVYSKYAEEKGILVYPSELTRLTHLWEAIYHHVIIDDAAFARVNQRSWVVADCGHDWFPSHWKNSIFHNFKTRAQLAQAYYSAGDVSIGGVTVGTAIDGISDDIGTCCDGGKVTYFLNSTSALLYYNFAYSVNTASPKLPLDRMEWLYRKGVDETIRLLTSKDLTSDPMGRIPMLNSAKGGMRIIVPKHDQSVNAGDFKPLKEQYATWLSNSTDFFYDVAAGTAVSRPVHTATDMQMIV